MGDRRRGDADGDRGSGSLDEGILGPRMMRSWALGRINPGPLAFHDSTGLQYSKKPFRVEEEAERVPLGERTAMATAAARGATSAPANETDKKMNLMKEVRAHEVAISELNSLPPSRPVYQKTGNLFFRKSVKSVVTAEQKQLDLARNRLNKLDQA